MQRCRPLNASSYTSEQPQKVSSSPYEKALTAVDERQKDTDAKTLFSFILN